MPSALRAGKIMGDNRAADTDQWSDFVVTDDGVFDRETGFTFRRGVDGRLSGSIPLDENDVPSLIRRFEIARQVYEARQAHGSEPSMDDY